MTQQARRTQLWIEKYVFLIMTLHIFPLLTPGIKILRKYHASVVYDHMQKEIDEYDAMLTRDATTDSCSQDNDNTDDVYHVQLGSRGNQRILSLLEDIHRGDPAFNRLEVRVRTFISLIHPSILPSTSYKVRPTNSIFGPSFTPIFWTDL